MLKKIIKTISVAAVLTTTLMAAGPKCTINNFLDQGQNYLQNLSKSKIYKNLNSKSNKVGDGIEKMAAIAGIKEGAARRIKDDLGLSNMTLNLKDLNGQTFTISLQDATLNAYKYFYIHLYNKLKEEQIKYGKSYVDQFAAAAIDMSDFLYFVSKPQMSAKYKTFGKNLRKNRDFFEASPFLTLVYLREPANLQKLTEEPEFFNGEFGSIATGVVRGYIVAQRDYQLKRSIPEEVLNFAYYVITGKFDKADEITLKEIQKGGGFTGIMQYCLVEQLKYRNR